MSNSKTVIVFQQTIEQNLVTVEKTADLLTLHFNNGLIQTQIDTRTADSLPLAGNRLMLSHLMFNLLPDSVLLGGCGGGAIARWFHAVAPQTMGIAIESSATIIELARKYFDFPPLTSNWTLLQDDIRHYLQTTDRQFDFILLDLEEHGTTPDWLIQEDFIALCKNRLSSNGVVTFNIVAHQAEDFARALWPVRQQFPQHTYCLSCQETHNIMITAFIDPPGIDQLEQKATQAKDRFHIEYDQLYQQLLKENPPHSGIL